tara:strand:+ start:800 stop:1240 length:441 start_codon:yes stop_codon:yes gene_type:complete
MRSVLIFFFAFSLTYNYSYSQTDPLLEFIEQNKDASPGKVINVSSLQLITTPEKYHDKVIRVIGYLNLEFEGTALYAYKSDYDNHNYKNSIWINLPMKGRHALSIQCSKKYVSIIGTFNAEQNGHFGMFSGTIMNLRRIDLIEDKK